MPKSRPFLPCILKNKFTNLKFDQFYKVKVVPKGAKSADRDKIELILNVVRIHQHATFQAIPSKCSQGNAWKTQVWPVSLSQSGIKMGKVNRTWPTSSHFLRWSRSINMRKSRPFLPKNAWKPRIWPVTLIKVVPKVGKSTDCGQNLLSSEGGQDTSTCQILGLSFHVFSGIIPSLVHKSDIKEVHGN